LLDESSEEALDDGVHSAKQDASLSVNVRLVLLGHGGLENKGRAESDGPCEGNIRGLAGLVLVDGERGVDACAFLALALFACVCVCV